MKTRHFHLRHRHLVPREATHCRAIEGSYRVHKLISFLLDNLTKVAADDLGVSRKDVMLRLGTCVRLGQLGNGGESMLSMVNCQSRHMIIFVL